MRDLAVIISEPENAHVMLPVRSCPEVMLCRKYSRDDEAKRGRPFVAHVPPVCFSNPLYLFQQQGLGSYQDDLLSMHSTSSNAPPTNSASISDATTPGFLSHLVVTSASSLSGDGDVVTSAVSAVSESTPVDVAGDPHAPGVEGETGAGNAADMEVNAGTEAGTPSSLQGGVALTSLPQTSGDSQDTPGSSSTVSQQQQQQQRPVVTQILPLPSLPSLPLPVPVGTVPPLAPPFLAPTSSAPSGPPSIVGNISRYALPPAGPLAQHPQLPPPPPPPPPPHLPIPLSTANSTSGAQPGSQASDVVGGIHDDAPPSIQSTSGHHLYYASLPPIVSPSPPVVPVVVVGGVDGSNGNNINNSTASAPAGLLPLPMSSLPAAENFRLQPGTSGTSDLGANPEEQATVAAMELASSLPDQPDLHGQPGSAGSPEEIERPETPPYVPEVQMKGNEPWTAEEDERLKVAVQRHSLRNWKKIARCVTRFREVCAEVSSTVPFLRRLLRCEAFPCLVQTIAGLHVVCCGAVKTCHARQA